MKRSLFRWGGLLVAILLAGIGIAIYLWPESYDHAGNEMVRAMQAGDVDVYLRYMDPKEAARSGANRETLSRLVNLFLRKRLLPCCPVHPTVDHDAQGAIYAEIESAPYVGDFKVALKMQRVGRKIIVRSMLDALVRAALHAEVPVETRVPSKYKNGVARQGTPEEEEAMLKKTGLFGVVIEESSGTTFRTWDEYFRGLKG